MIEFILRDMFFAAVAGFGFAYACNPPLKTLILSALLAAIAHGLRFTLVEYFHFQTLAIATFVASFLHRMFRNCFSKNYQNPC